MIQYTKEYIRQLLDRFMQGETTLEEEDVLARYFQEADVPTEWEDYRLLFVELEAMKPQAASPLRKRWTSWAAAAVIAVGLVLTATLWPSADRDVASDLVMQPREVQAPATSAVALLAQAADTFRSSSRAAEGCPDSIAQPTKARQQPERRKLRRKVHTTPYDYDKMSILLAQAEESLAEEQLAAARLREERVIALLDANGYIPVMDEDGTIIYVNEETEYYAYEE